MLNGFAQKNKIGLKVFHYWDTFFYYYMWRL